MKKRIAKEFLWFIVSVLLAVPLSFLFLSCMDIVGSENDVFEVQLFLFGFLISFAGIYLTRFIVFALKAIAE